MKNRNGGSAMGSGETVGDNSTGPVGSHEEKYQAGAAVLLLLHT